LFHSFPELASGNNHHHSQQGQYPTNQPIASFGGNVISSVSPAAAAAFVNQFQQQYPFQQQQQQQRPSGNFLQPGATSFFLWTKDSTLSLDQQRELCEEGGNLMTSNYSCSHNQGFSIEIDGFHRYALYIRLGWRFRNATLIKNMGKLR